ncbi:MAG: PEP-CTERM sorting domain-containing protein [Isosphaeraceae bacterium]|nr:PEP-CTERM sorting domain-containing protein [Isosphaeraceae bacterium]
MITACAVDARAGLVQPTSATAESEFSGSYDIGNAIDGSGLPAGFTPASAHATYTTHNHWTTKAAAVNEGKANASFFFADPVHLDAFHLWNHRSNGIASNAFYEVTSFDLAFYDSGGMLLRSILGLSALGETATAQTYHFPIVIDVSRVDFKIVANQGLPRGTNPNYTGVAEVAFNAVAVPEPSTIALGLLGAGFGLARAARRRRA